MDSSSTDILIGAPTAGDSSPVRAAAALGPPPGAARARRPLRARWAEFQRHGIPAIWFTGLMTLVIVLMLGGMLGLVVANGLRHLWPARLVEVRTASGVFLGPVMQTGTRPGEGGRAPAPRLLLEIGNRDVYGLDFRWFDLADVESRTKPDDAVVVERMENGDFHGYLRKLLEGDQVVAEGAAGWPAFEKALHAPRAERPATGRAVFTTADGTEKELALRDIVRATRPNRMNVLQRAGFFFAKLFEFMWTGPRESNTEGGIYPALFGTLVMVLLMTVVVVPLGVIAALYLHEYAKHGPVLGAVRLAVNNLAGVPSIVFGMFGLAFFVYGVGGFIDRTFFAAQLPNPTFGTGGLLWASLTLALLTLPVVIVATEEGLSAVPRANREAALALGATQWQALWHVVLPNAMPGILTGVILAVSRGAGEVAPLMLTGVVKLAPALALDGSFPFLHLERKFMHLGFHIYDVSMQSPNVEAAKPMVYTTTLVLLALVVALNATAIVVRQRMRRHYRGAAL